MAGILFNNDNDPLKGKEPESRLTPPATQSANEKPLVAVVEQKEDDFAIFPQWDIVPPNAIINPRIKKNI